MKERNKKKMNSKMTMGVITLKSIQGRRRRPGVEWRTIYMVVMARRVGVERRRRRRQRRRIGRRRRIAIGFGSRRERHRIGVLPNFDFASNIRTGGLFYHTSTAINKNNQSKHVASQSTIRSYRRFITSLH